MVGLYQVTSYQMTREKATSHIDGATSEGLCPVMLQLDGSYQETFSPVARMKMNGRPLVTLYQAEMTLVCQKTSYKAAKV